MTLRELNGLDEMLQTLDVLQELYPSLTPENYLADLKEMLPNNRYGQVAVFDGDTCVGVSGYWIGTKLWCCKYLEIDNLVVSAKVRSKGVGKMIFDYLAEKAQEEECSMVSLDSYTSNFKAHKFFYNEGFAPKGFHFINILDAEKIR
ncbi:MAG: GNAT family N-acetyltransferase [Crocinitomicaceae bacterium]|jgi:GNAT superfamily N-acetyltransferase|nr:GNAT family N-acetyltransferase [Crocinitomicaceae bacterium]MDP4797759.1 GNAT family N-acetyltransferase [Crocinitomicaceae bacterium]MDP4866083.1 GNAT family N-acetyltransferase [Crocinitomicaceae bacterium]MDP5010331.1 GNAT family N-acetyltransferase [Crocinitomicaceae bacterium]MDP5099246.1 GNAT family N-acetyltransferase [Crocinitomicaceae bacterium]